MLCSDQGMVTAGILVENDGESRLTVSIHCWQRELEKILEELGNPKHFQIKQSRTPVGYVSSRLGNSGIGLATLNDQIKFRNKFMDLPGGPVTLLPSDQLRANDYYAIDSFTTGRQGNLLYKGKRVIIKEDKTRNTDRTIVELQADLPDEGKYMVIAQGIYATSEPMPNGEPFIRAGCCVSALIRLSKVSNIKDGSVGTSTRGEVPAVMDQSTAPSPAIGKAAGIRGSRVEQRFAHAGELSGFMHWSDIREKHTITPSLFCYAEITDHLIEAGWRVAVRAKEQNGKDLKRDVHLKVP